MVLALTSSLLVALSPRATAQDATPEPVLAGAAGEFQPVRADGFLAWQQNSTKRPNRFKVFAMPDGDDRFKVNAKKTQAANGGIDGSTLVYQQYKGGQSDLKFFDLLTKTRSAPPKGVNTKKHWEYWPSLSGQWLLFGRLMRNGNRKVILFDRNAGTRMQLDKTTSKNGFLAPGQVSGDYVVWYKCQPSKDCDVFRYNIPAEEKFKIPNPGRSQHAPSVTPQGTVYFAANECGSPIRLLRFPLGGPVTSLAQLPRGGDVSSTRTFIGDNGAAQLFYEHNVCNDPTGSDIWKITEEAMFDLTVTKQGGGNGTVTSAPAGINCGADCSDRYEEGATVTLTAASQGQSSFKSWDGSCSGTQNTCTLTMDAAKDVIANFDPPPNLANLAVTKTGPGSGTVTSNPTGINCGADCSENYPVGTSVTLTASAAAKSTFGGWSDACTGTATTCTLTMDAAKTATATFNTVTHTLTVTKAGNGSGTVTSNPTGINCGATCTANFAVDSSVTLTAAAATGSTFTGWTGACTGNSTVCTVTMNTAKSATASFTLITRNLTVTRAGNGSGTVTSAPAGINCGATCTAGFDHGTSVALTATPDAGSEFTGWTGDCTGTTNPCNLTMDAAKNVTANFALKRTLTVNTAGNGTGTVTSAPGTIDCDRANNAQSGTCSDSYSEGTVVTLTAAADDTSSKFDGWTDCPSSPTPTTCELTMDADKAVTATFTLETRTLTVTTSGTGTGTVTGTGIDCGHLAGAPDPAHADCTEDYDHGTNVVLTGNGEWAAWGDACAGQGNPCTIAIGADPNTVSATFTAPPPAPTPRTLTVIAPADGTITSADGFIDCGASGTGLCSQDYNDGDSVTLTGTGEPGLAFDSWGDDCALEPNPCVLAMDANKTVSAIFSAVPAPRSLTWFYPSRLRNSSTAVAAM